MKKTVQIEASKLLHDFLNSDILYGKVVKNYETPVFNKLLPLETGCKPYSIIAASQSKSQPIKKFLEYMALAGIEDVRMINDLVDPNRKHPLTEEYRNFLDGRIENENIHSFVLVAINKFLIACEELPEWFLTPEIFGYLKNEPTRKTYARAVGEFLTVSDQIPEITAFFREKGFNVQEIKERFLPTKEALVLSAAQKFSIFDTSDITEALLLRITLVDKIKLDQLLIATLGDFDSATRTLFTTRLSDPTADLLESYLNLKRFTRKKDVLFIKPKPLLVLFSRRGAIRAGLSEDYQNMNALRALFQAN